LLSYLNLCQEIKTKEVERMMRDKSKVKFGILTFVILLTILAFVGCASAKTWYVDDDGGCDFTKIQDAINATSPGDTILVYNGTYYENLWISKDNLILTGENRDKTIIDGGGNKNVVMICSDGIKISEFTIQNGGWSHYAIEIDGVGCTIDNNKLLDSKSGVSYGSHHTISNNIITNNYQGGIDDLGSNNKIINNWIFNNTGDGLSLRRDYNTIINNTIANNEDNGIDIGGSSNNNTVFNNTIMNNGKNGIELRGGGNYNNEITNNTICNNDECAVYLHSSNDNRIANNNLSNNGEAGIFVSGDSSYNQIEGNTILNNNDGISFSRRSGYDSINNQIITNTIKRNVNGINLQRSDSNQIINNIVVDNADYDIFERYDSYNNSIFNNTARRIRGDLDKNMIYNNIYSRPLINSAFTANAATIDGVLEEGEWLNKIEIKLNGFDGDDHYDGEDNELLTKTADLYVMNDAENIYLALVLEDMLEEDEDFLRIEFDQGDDAVHTDGNEDMASFCGLGYNDCHWNVDEWQVDINYHGEMGRRWSVADRKYVYEFRKPLNPGDPQDIMLKAGDTVGFHIVAFDSGVGYRYPMDAVSFDTYHSKDEDIIFTPPVGDESGAWKKWADLIIGMP
jgi:nitrous oxidase accessory protein